MAYLDDESSQTGGTPNELYRFVGTYANFYYTSGPKDVEFQADDEDAPNLYKAIAIKRSAVKVGTQDDDGLDLTIEMGVQNEIVKVYGFRISPPKLNLTIWRYHKIAEYVPYWTGPVDNIQVAGGKATLRVPSTLATALIGNVPNVYYQTPCNHSLYDERCGLDRADWSVEAEVVSVAGKLIEVDDVGALDGKLRAGEIVLSSGERRMIVEQAGNDITVNFPFAQIAEGDTIELAAGCNHQQSGDCINKFNNGPRYGGFLYIPADNPFETGIEPGKTGIADNACLPEVGGYLINPDFELGILGWTSSYDPNPLEVKPQTSAWMGVGPLAPHSGSNCLSVFNPSLNLFGQQTFAIPEMFWDAVDAGKCELRNIKVYCSSPIYSLSFNRLSVRGAGGGITTDNTYYTCAPKQIPWTLLELPNVLLNPGNRTIIYDLLGGEGSMFDNFAQPQFVVLP